MKKIIIHIGSPKTGTTSIQDCLSRNSKYLLTECGILFPVSGRNVIAHHPLVADVRAKFNGDKVAHHCYGNVLPGTGWDSLISEIHNCVAQVNTTIISSEDFFILYRRGTLDAIRYVKSMLAEFDVKIIVYLRRQDHFIDSLYNQQIKATLNSTSIPCDLINNHPTTKQSYLSILDAWADVFGVNNVIVRPFDKEIFFNNDLIQDFFNIIGVPNCSLPYSPEVVNERLSPEELVFKRTLNKFYDDNLDCIQVFDKLRACVDFPSSRKYLLLSSDDYKKIVVESRFVNLAIEEKYFKGERFFNSFPTSDDLLFLDFGSIDVRSYIGRLEKCSHKLNLHERDRIKITSAILLLYKKNEFHTDLGWKDSEALCVSNLVTWHKRYGRSILFKINRVKARCCYLFSRFFRK